MTTLNVQAYSLDNQPGGVWIDAEFRKTQDAQRFAALFPRSCQLHAETLSGSGRGCVHAHIPVLFSQRGGKLDPAAVRRYRTIIDTAAEQDVEVAWSAPFSSSYKTQGAFETACSV